MKTLKEFLSEADVKNPVDKNKENAKKYSKLSDHHAKIEKKILADVNKASGDTKAELEELAKHHGWARHAFKKASDAYKAGNDDLGDAHKSTAKDHINKAVEMQSNNANYAKY